MHRCSFQLPLAFASLILLISSEATSYSLKNPSVKDNLIFKNNHVHKSIAYPFILPSYERKDDEDSVFIPDRKGDPKSQESYYGDLRLSPLMDLYSSDGKDLEGWNSESSSDARYSYKKKGSEESALHGQDINDYIKFQREMTQNGHNSPIHGVNLERPKDTSRKRVVRPYDVLDESLEDHQQDKRQGPSLSIVNPLDVLRQKYLLEMARRRMKVNQNQIQVNAELLKNLGKRKKRNSSQLSKKKVESPRWQNYYTRQHTKNIQVARSGST